MIAISKIPSAIIVDNNNASIKRKCNINNNNNKLNYTKIVGNIRVINNNNYCNKDSKRSTNKSKGSTHRKIK